jgi:ribosomal-protein-alanine N-acetyltransferase
MWRTERLRIEPLGHEHAEELFAALDHPSVGLYIGGPDVTTLDALHTRIDRLAEGPGADWPERWWNFAARRVEDGVVIGRLEATTYDGWAEVAYVFGPEYGGQGFATEGARWLSEHLAAELAVTDQWAAIHPENVASIRLIERIGFLREDAPARTPASYDEGDLVFHRG